MGHEVTFFSAFLIGLFGSVHCVGMCGGIVAGLSVGTIQNPGQNPAIINNGTIQDNIKVNHTFTYPLFYNLGRISSYAFAGFIAGFLGSQGSDVVNLDNLIIAPYIVGIFMILLGGYIGGWFHVLLKLEMMGSYLWRYIQPFGKCFLPLRKRSHAVFLGMLWGWLPCGLVYSTLVWAMTTADGYHGALLMTAFGLGTLPVLLSIGLIGDTLVSYTRKPLVRSIAGAGIVIFGLYTIFSI